MVEDLAPTWRRMRSFIRFRQRMNVLFPQPDGPMNAVTAFLCTSSVTPSRAVRPRSDRQVLDAKDRLARADIPAGGRCELAELRAVDPEGHSPFFHWCRHLHCLPVNTPRTPQVSSPASSPGGHLW